ncbi:LOW QUALITY PROTEIN: T-box-containing protein 2-like [Clavelina lepadiformis]|uniref:LOW QUALITY PROTEIN: T-box-containing protein 2-like n=1 Tax=Clavelina lepadiformis TaxID=159417 RepID=UPI0040433254
MIVTKGGRRMFPGYRVQFSGMDPNAQYCVLMEMSRLDEHRYKFQNGQWNIAGKGEPHVPKTFFLHPNSPTRGQFWTNEVVSFHKVKLSNYCGNPDKGKPRIHVVRTDDVSNIHFQRITSFSFQQTEFMTVTTYQNQEATKFKVQNNPFARGFRPDGGKTKTAMRASSISLHETKRKEQSTQQRNEETAERHQILRKDPRITSSAQSINFEPQYQAFHAAPPAPINEFNFSQSESSTATSMELNQPAPCYNSRAEALRLAALETNNFSAPVASLEGWNLAVPSQYDSNQATFENSTYLSSTLMAHLLFLR